MSLVFFLFFFSGVLTLFFVRSHFLMSLLSLELIFLSLYLFVFSYLNFFFFEYVFGVFFLIVGVCDGVLGLSILVYLVRSVGNDYLDSMGLF
nr:NADH dehydrogenase subunit 4L [Borysthenes sp. 1 WQW-2023a]